MAWGQLGGAIGFRLFTLPNVVPFLWYDLVAGRSPMLTWHGMLGLGLPAIFFIVALLLMVSRFKGTTPSDRRSTATTPKALSAVAFIYGLVLLFVGVLMLARQDRRPPFEQIPSGYMLVFPGAALLLLNGLVRRGQVFAMLAAFVASLVPWIYPMFWLEVSGGRMVLDWFNLSHLVIPTLFGILVATAVLSVLREGQGS